jgi:hypothetical protein
VGNFLENVHFEDRETDGKITLKWTLKKSIVRMEGGWNWLRIVFNGGLWY